ncbi:MAG: hypothetical protein K2W96_22390 [Gemmataceae bacterium]|nr:hypothetical protein [Gemmataceae bacterium]
MSDKVKQSPTSYGERMRCPECGASSSAPEAASGPSCWVCITATTGEHIPHEPAGGFLGWGCLVPCAAMIAALAAGGLLTEHDPNKIGMRLAGVLLIAAAIGVPLLIAIGFAKGSQATWGVLFPVGILALIPNPGLLLAVLIVAGIVALVSAKPRRESTDVSKQPTPFARAMYYGVAVAAVLPIAGLSLLGVLCGALFMTFQR